MDSGCAHEYLISPKVYPHFRDFCSVGLVVMLVEPEMIAEQVFHCHELRDGIFPHGDMLSSGEVVFGDGAS